MMPPPTLPERAMAAGAARTTTALMKAATRAERDVMKLRMVVILKKLNWVAVSAATKCPDGSV